MKNKMSNAPIYYALSQVKFNPIIAMEENYIAKIQDSFRNKGYSVFEEKVMKEFQFEMKSERFDHNVVNRKIWIFMKQDCHDGFILDQSSLIYHTTHYNTHNEFFRLLIDGLDLVNDVVNIEYFDGIGLRYVDAIIPSLCHENLEKFLIKEVHCFKQTNAVLKKRIQALSESVFLTDNHPLGKQGILVSRVYHREGEFAYPPGIEKHGLETMEKLKNITPCSHVIIDTDHHVSGHMLYDVKALSHQLTLLHDPIKEVFNNIATGYARKVWK